MNIPPTPPPFHLPASLSPWYVPSKETVAPGVANDSKASWRLLGNTIQRAALEHVCAPFLDGLEELRDQMSDD